VLQVLDRHGGQLRPVWDARDSYSFALRARHDLVLNNDDNPRLRLFAPRPALRGCRVVRDEDVFEPGSEALRELRIRLAAIELGHDATGFADLSGTRRVAIIVHRAAGDPRSLGAEEEALLSALMPHVQQSVSLMHRLQAIERDAELLMTACQTLAGGMLVCAADGRISWANSSARAIIDGSPHLRRTDGRLRPIRASDQAALAELLAQAAAGGGLDPAAPLPLAIGLGDGAEMVQVLAVGARSFGTTATGPPSGILLLLRQPAGPPKISPQSIRRLFALSAAEARLTAALCDGLSLGDYAAAKGITVGTARIQLKRALAKTDTHRQSELVRRVCASLAWSGSPSRRQIEDDWEAPRSRLQ
jgi:DNA-binding CsgD family transcriptional regulator